MNKPVILFDLDGTLCQYNEALERDLEKLRSPFEPPYKRTHKHRDYIGERMELIKGNASWWVNLEKFQLGFDIHHIATSLGYRIVVLTQGPKNNSEAWKGKLIWCRNNLDPDTDVIITRDKGLVYGKVLVDDYPEYAEAWLKHRPRGLVIMPAHPWNKTYKHKQVIRYSGLASESSEIHQRLKIIAEQFIKDNNNDKEN
jgi:FMN phosphatase YigB (HAD superfamily)